MATTIWLTDRSRQSTGLGRCRRERYLRYHFGPTGYGIVHKSESLPLATGTYVHKALEAIFVHLATSDTYPTVEVIRGAILEAIKAYEKRVEERGYRGLLASEKADAIVVEQCALLTGMVWGLCRTVLPWLHKEYRILQAEVESLYVLGCTCGLGPTAPQAEHEAKDCEGIGQQIRQDVIAQHRVRNTLAYFEAKTTGWVGETWAPQWETKPQLPLGTLGIREKYGQDVAETYILGLYKGRRTKISDASGGEVYLQDSPFCVGYRRPGNPPLAPDDWLPVYKWVDTETGEQRTASRAHKKAGIWELEGSDWPEWLNAKAADPSLTPAEFWAAFLPQSVLEKQVFLVGPMLPQAKQLADLKEQIVGEEQRWKDTLWSLYETKAKWASPEYQSALNRLVPASYECRKYGGGRNECEYVPLCFGLDGWEDPLANEKFVPRLPHHIFEVDQMIARGLAPEGFEAEDDDE